MFDTYRIAGPLIRLLSPETGHRLAIRALAAGLVPVCAPCRDAVLETEVWGLRFPNPLGTAAGFDKNAEAVDPTLKQGFGFVEVGTVTPRPQPGTPKPRLFRLMEDEAVVNRMGFNNEGLDAVMARLAARQGKAGIVGVNVGKNRDSEDAEADYVAGIRAAAPLAGFIVVNVSSPNTPGLRDLQKKSELGHLLELALKTRDETVSGNRPPVLVKIAPDLSAGELSDIASTCLETGIDGIIATNTTVARPDSLRGAAASEKGGLSGRPLFEMSTKVLADLYRLTGGRIPLVGVGGVSCGADAYAKVRAGASLVQLYSAMVFHGPAVVNRVNRDLAALLRRDGFARLSDAVGADHK